MTNLVKPSTGTLHLLDLDGKFAKIDAMGQNRLCGEIKTVNNVNAYRKGTKDNLVSSHKTSTAALRGRLKAFYWYESRIKRLVGLDKETDGRVKLGLDENTIISLPISETTNVNDIKDPKGFYVMDFNNCYKGQVGRAMVYTFFIEYHNDMVLLKETDSTDSEQEDDEQSHKNYTLATYEDKEFIVQQNGIVKGNIVAAPKAVVSKCLTELLKTLPQQPEPQRTDRNRPDEDAKVASKARQQSETTSNNDDKDESDDSNSDSPVTPRKTRQQLKAAASNVDGANGSSDADSPVTQRKTRQQLKAAASNVDGKNDPSDADSPVAPRKTRQQLKATRAFDDKRPPKHRLIMEDSTVARKTRQQLRTKRTVDDQNGPDADPTPASKIRPQKRARVREEGSSRPSSSATKIDAEDPSDVVLMVFQASPLIHSVDGNDTALEVLDFEDEEDALREALDGTGISLKFEAATDKNFGNCFLDRGSKMFHFSGHGQDMCLFMENKYGGTHKINVDENLKAWIQSGGNKIKLAFLAASSSRNAGEVFIDAGVPFVVCVENGKLLSHETATIFARVFYRALANGQTVQQAYDSARLGVVHSSDVMQTRLDPREEAEKFVLLTNKDYRNTVLFRKPKQRRTTNMDHPDRPRVLLPFPPGTFMGREMEMYSVQKSMLVGGERLVTVTGPRGMGKKSFCTAIGHYMEKRKMWGDVYWIPSPRPEVGDDIAGMLFQIMEILKKHSTTDSFRGAADYKTVCGRIYDLLYLKKAIIVIDATKIQAEGIKLLSIFLHDLLENTKRVKLLVCHRKCTPLVPPTMTGFPSCHNTVIQLKKLELKSMFLLFGRNCRYASPGSWNYDLINQRFTQNEETMAKVLGDGIPAHTIVLAKTIDQSEYNKLVDPSVTIQESDFSKVLRILAKCRAEKGDDAPKQASPPVKSQQQVQTHFVPLLQKEKVFRKISSAYVRPAKKGETITTVIDGKNETQNTVADDTSKIVCGTKAREYYVLPDDEFRASYDAESSKPIPEGVDDEHLQTLRQQGFSEYQSKRYVFGHVVTEEDMQFFRHEADTSNSEAYFEAPWGAKMRVEKGDYLAIEYSNTQGKQKDGVYRIEKGVFEKTYVEQTDMAVDEPKDMAVEEPKEA